jgi:hypothetical protein
VRLIRVSLIIEYLQRYWSIYMKKVTTTNNNQNEFTFKSSVRAGNRNARGVDPDGPRGFAWGVDPDSPARGVDPDRP